MMKDQSSELTFQICNVKQKVRPDYKDDHSQKNLTVKNI